jgi:hypothetical protein
MVTESEPQISIRAIRKTKTGGPDESAKVSQEDHPKLRKVSQAFFGAEPDVQKLVVRRKSAPQPIDLTRKHLLSGHKGQEEERELGEPVRGKPSSINFISAVSFEQRDCFFSFEAFCRPTLATVTPFLGGDYRAKTFGGTVTIGKPGKSPGFFQWAARRDALFKRRARCLRLISVGEHLCWAAPIFGDGPHFW